MSDQYVPNNPKPYGSEADKYRQDRDLPPVQQTVTTDSGWGTGLAVAIVVVILALVGFAMFSGGSGTSTAPATAPDVTIQNNSADPNAAAVPDQGTTVPDATLPDATAPATPAPDANTMQSTPDTGADATAPAPDATAPAPDATAPAPDAGTTTPTPPANP